MKPLTGDLFPEDFPYSSEKEIGWAWHKYFRTPNNYFVLPKFNNYANMEVLVQIFNGVPIDTRKQFVNIIDHPKKHDYMDLPPSLEEAKK